MKMQHVLVFEMLAVSFLRAWLISLACSPIFWSPISPSISAFGVRAATESTTMMSIAPLRIRSSAISRACSPLSGWDMRRVSTSTPRFFA